MTTVIQSAHDRLVREVAERYIRQGYPVLVEPLESDLPDFLKGFRPDLIVKTPEGNLVVEVKLKSNAVASANMQGLIEAVKSHPDWRFHLVVDNKREDELLGAEMPVLFQDEVQARLQASQQLADAGLLDSALLIAWTALEAVLREQGRAEGLFLPNQGPGALITALYTEGSLEYEDYATLNTILSARNQAAHGYRVPDLDRSLVEQIQTIANRMLSQQRLAA